MSDINNITGTARLTKDCQILKANSGKDFLSMHIAINNYNISKKQDEAVFIKAVSFNSNLANYLKKGVKIGFSGKLSSNTYNKDGNTITSYYIIISELSLLSPKKENKPEAVDDGEEYPF